MLAAVFCQGTKNKTMDLEIKYLAPYLPYELKVQGQTHKYIFELGGLDGEIALLVGTGRVDFFDIKPILQPLSKFGDIDDLRKVHEFIGLGKWCEAYDQYFDAWFNDACSVDKLVLQCPYDVLQYFFSNHYDVFGLIELGLAIDINTLSVNGSLTD